MKPYHRPEVVHNRAAACDHINPEQRTQSVLDACLLAVGSFYGFNDDPGLFIRCKIFEFFNEAGNVDRDRASHDRIRQRAVDAFLVLQICPIGKTRYFRNDKFQSFRMECDVEYFFYSPVEMKFSPDTNRFVLIAVRHTLTLGRLWFQKTNVNSAGLCRFFFRVI